MHYTQVENKDKMFVSDAFLGPINKFQNIFHNFNWNATIISHKYCNLQKINFLNKQNI